MRKRFKNKARSCALCKPHKRKWVNRWGLKDLDLIVRTEREIKGHLGLSAVDVSDSVAYRLSSCTELPGKTMGDRL